MTALRLVYQSPGIGGIEHAPLPQPGAGPGAGQVVIDTLKSGISRGTESLVFAGKVPQSEWQRMRCPHQVGTFPFPVSYGYALVGRICAVGTAVRDLQVGDTVFVLHPHQTRIVVEAASARRIPDGVPPARATLSANMETALNAIWDAALAPGMKATVVGGGVVGLLTAYLARRVTGEPVTLVDINADRAAVAAALGLEFSLPDSAVGGVDTVFHTSATGSGLQTAIGLAGFEGRIIEMSWYGDKPVTLALGGAFHSQRLQIIASQVGHVSPARRATMDYDGRMREAMGYLEDSALDELLEPEIGFMDLPDHLDRVLGPASRALCQIVDYGNNATNRA